MRYASGHSHSNTAPEKLLSLADSGLTPSPGNALSSQLCSTALLDLHISSAISFPPKPVGSGLPATGSFGGHCRARFLRAPAALRLRRASPARVPMDGPARAPVDGGFLCTCRVKPASNKGIVCHQAAEPELLDLAPAGKHNASICSQQSATGSKLCMLSHTRLLMPFMYRSSRRLMPSTISCRRNLGQ